MIVTRQRKKPFPWRRLILPVVAIGLVIFAFVWPPSRNVIAAGPMGPVWSVVGNAFNNVATPFHWAAQNQVITDRNTRIAQLEKSNADQASKLADSQQKIKDLTAQVQTLQTNVANASAAPNASSAPAGPASVGASSAPSGANDLSQGATPDMRRTALVWANMEPENAAKVVQKLPIPYVARILALMSPDTVGALLDALPADYAAKLTQDHPELKK